ncbi:MAG: 16S rRNA processing protein RimM [Candidatus Latescibacteria bacterium]|nr:16S rRNA processing protein RimM [bacterium]MBD3422888.1 16S rRNA processing protein RimM [Candidatus Latescibacterota bacterium]
MHQMLDYAELGDIVNTVGLKGEIKLLPGPDFWTGALERDQLSLVSVKAGRRPVRMEKYRRKGGTYVIKFTELESIQDAENVVGHRLELSLEGMDESDYPERGLRCRLVGMQVFMTEGEMIGEVIDLVSSSMQDCIIVAGENRRYILPFVPEIIPDIDYGKGLIRIDPPEGLLDLVW